MNADRKAEPPVHAGQNPLRPLPTPTEWDQGYWDAARRGELVVQSCAECGVVRSFPRLLCPDCGSFEFVWLRTQGTGTLYSWSILRRSFHPGFTDLPLIVAIVELDDHPGVHLVTNLLDVPPEVLDDAAACEQFIEIGAPVEVTFERFETITLPQFRLRV